MFKLSVYSGSRLNLEYAMYLVWLLSADIAFFRTSKCYDFSTAPRCFPGFIGYLNLDLWIQGQGSRQTPFINYTRCKLYAIVRPARSPPHTYPHHQVVWNPKQKEEKPRRWGAATRKTNTVPVHRSKIKYHNIDSIIIDSIVIYQFNVWHGTDTLDIFVFNRIHALKISRQKVETLFLQTCYLVNYKLY